MTYNVFSGTLNPTHLPSCRPTNSVKALKATSAVRNSLQSLSDGAS